MAFLDVLGFKQLVESVGHDHLVSLYTELLQTAHDRTLTPILPDDQRSREEDPYYPQDEIAHHRFLHILMASDSILVYSDGDGWGDASLVIWGVARLLADGFRLGLPLRGAIAWGDFSVVDGDFDQASGGPGSARALGFVGVGLVRAVQLENLFEWSGAVLHPEFVEHLKHTVTGEASDGPVMAWDLLRAARIQASPARKPNRATGSGLYWAVNWPLVARNAEPPLSENDVGVAFESYGRDASDERVQLKRSETLAFWTAAAST